MKTLQTDIVVVGAGLAGTLFALELAKKRPDIKILILNKKEKKQSSSYLAQGGIAAVLPGTGDSMRQHLADTLVASGGSCNKEVAAYFISHAAEAIQILEGWGTLFDRQANGNMSLALEGGHSSNRVLHHKDSTGRHILEKLHAAIPLYTNIKLLNDVQVLELQQPFYTAAVCGAVGWDSFANIPVAIQADTVVLATGGIGGLYSYSTNPATATGEGIYLASRAGAECKDLAYVQFHPTALWNASGTQLSLISEAVRGAGAILRNEKGERFMEGLHPARELAPRDIVARCISREIEKQQLPCVYLDATGLGKLEWRDHFPGIFEICGQAGIDPTTDWIPVVPAAHYSCGGIATSVNGETAIKNLYVIGESACTGLHGANRLASNSLLEATLMASSLAIQLAKNPLPVYNKSKTPVRKIENHSPSDEHLEKILLEIRKIVQEGCGIEKSTLKLRQAYRGLQDIQSRIRRQIPQHSLQFYRLNMVVKTAILLIKSSREQTKNLGVFYNVDLEKNAVIMG